MLDNDELKFSNAVISVSNDPVLVFRFPIWANWEPVAAIKLVTSPSKAVIFVVLVVTLPAIDELNAVEEPDIIASVTSIAIWLLLTVVVIGPEPAKVKVWPELNESLAPLSAARVNDVSISAISLAILLM